MDNLVKEIDQIIGSIRDKMNSGAPVHPEWYTDKGLKLAVLKQHLGRKKTNAKRAQLVAEHQKTQEAMAKGLGVTAQKEWVRLETTEQRLKFDGYETEHKDLGKVIDMVRSHASAIREDK